jgi:hypothetical protein
MWQCISDSVSLPVSEDVNQWLWCRLRCISDSSVTYGVSVTMVPVTVYQWQFTCTRLRLTMVSVTAYERQCTIDKPLSVPLRLCVLCISDNVSVTVYMWQFKYHWDCVSVYHWDCVYCVLVTVYQWQCTCDSLSISDIVSVTVYQWQCTSDSVSVTVYPCRGARLCG